MIGFALGWVHLIAEVTNELEHYIGRKGKRKEEKQLEWTAVTLARFLHSSTTMLRNPAAAAYPRGVKPLSEDASTLAPNSKSRATISV